MGHGEILFLTIVILFGSIHFIFTNLNSENEFRRSLAWLLGAILALIMFFYMPSRY